MGQHDGNMMMDPNATSHFNITTTTIHPDEFIGGPRYIAANPAAAWIYIIIAVVATVIGILGNMMILTCVLCIKALQSARNAFLINLAIADLIISGFADTLSVAGKKPNK